MKPLKIAILAKSPRQYSIRKLVEAGNNRGHDVQVINPLNCYMNISSHNPSIYFNGQELTGFHAVIPLIGSNNTFFSTAVVRQFEAMNVYVINESVAISRSNDKLRSLQILARKGIGLPSTGFAHSTELNAELIRLVGGAPLMIKLVEGVQGVGSVLSETDKAAESVIEAFRALRANILIQEYIEESQSSDIRCLVLGDKVLASVQVAEKHPDPDKMGHKFTYSKIKITPEERLVAIRASQALGIKFSVVDILRANHGAVVIEVDSSPVLKKFEQVTGKDLATLIIEHVEQNYKKVKKKKKPVSWG